VNVALNRPAYQVSTYYVEGYPTFYAKYANDGGNSSHLVDGPCAHTEYATNPWWAVDLGVALYIYGVKFTNRGDGSGKFVLRC